MTRTPHLPVRPRIALATVGLCGALAAAGVALTQIESASASPTTVTSARPATRPPAGPASAATSSHRRSDAMTGTATRPIEAPLAISAGLRPTHAGRAVDPECVLSWMPDSTGKLVNVHISTFLRNRHNIRAAKVNAQVKCRRVSMNVIVRVQLWKTGFIFDHKQSDTTVGPKGGNLVKNQGTWRQCANHTSSTFYGLAFGQATFQGTVYSTAIRTPMNATLPCGT